ncbi:DAD family-domain-containing protein [Lipomyces oligophaga]|uniref:DAD family-domain-containing protein n=1 Tax=Lipomyces oligophaga TaxID=45792 RepID=UPI0034CEB432
MAPKKQAKVPAKSPNKTVPATQSSSAATSTLNTSTTGSTDFAAIVRDGFDSYVKETPRRLKLVDSFMVFLVTVGVLQFIYCVLLGSFPFNAFLSGFSITVGQFVLAGSISLFYIPVIRSSILTVKASLRIQANPANSAEFSKVTPERAFADFVIGSLVLHFFAYNFIN